MPRVLYHQSVFDLIDLEPKESPQARELIEASEKRTGRRLPEAVRQWYLIEGAVALHHVGDWRERILNPESCVWRDYSNQDWPESVESVLRQFEAQSDERNEEWPSGALLVLGENQSVCHWFVQPDGSEDPPVVVDEDYDPHANEVITWKRVRDHFSAFVFDWIAGFYKHNYNPLSEREHDTRKRTRPAREKLYLNGLWLYAARAEALPPPCLDYLIENLEEGPRRQVAEGVMQYHFQDGDARLRVTTDRYGEVGGVSAWWLHAQSEDGLFRLAEHVTRYGNVGKTLQHQTKSARPVMERLRSLLPGAD